MRLTAVLSSLSLFVVTSLFPRIALASGPGADGGLDGGRPLAPTGAPCTAHAECRSNACVRGFCRARCDATAKCPTTQTCVSAGVCMPLDGGTMQPTKTTRETSDDGEEERDGKDADYWNDMPTVLEPPPSSNAGCMMHAIDGTSETSSAVFLAFAAAVVFRRRARGGRVVTVREKGSCSKAARCRS